MLSRPGSSLAHPPLQQKNPLNQYKAIKDTATPKQLGISLSLRFVAERSLVPRTSITLRGGRPGKTPTAELDISRRTGLKTS